MSTCGLNGCHGASDMADSASLDMTTTPPPTPDGGAGALTVTITSPQPGILVTVDGPNGYHQTLAATQTFGGLPSGSYLVTASELTVKDPIVSTVYVAIINGSPASVTAGGAASVTVSYRARAGSGALWIADYLSLALGYGATQLGRSGTTAPSTMIDVQSPGTGTQGIAIDPSGNLWATVNGTIVEYTLAALAAGGKPAPQVTIMAMGKGNLNYPVGLAFDSQGNLWVTNVSADTISKYTPAQLAAGGAPVPSVVVQLNNSEFVGQEAIAFDGDGNLWGTAIAGGNGFLLEYTVNQLAASGSPPPAVVLSNAKWGSVSRLAFDQTGNLWFTNCVDIGTFEMPMYTCSIGALTKAQRAASGSPTAAITLTVTATSLDGLALDESGDLWVLGNGSLSEFTPAQIAASGSPTPIVKIAVTNQSANETAPNAFPIGMAFNPHSSSLPLR
jgi:sugar lactone lactonase YvrE